MPRRQPGQGDGGGPQRCSHPTSAGEAVAGVGPALRAAVPYLPPSPAGRELRAGPGPPGGFVPRVAGGESAALCPLCHGVGFPVAAGRTHRHRPSVQTSSSPPFPCGQRTKSCARPRWCRSAPASAARPGLCGRGDAPVGSRVGPRGSGERCRRTEWVCSSTHWAGASRGARASPGSFWRCRAGLTPESIPAGMQGLVPVHDPAALRTQGWALPAPSESCDSAAC